MLGDLGLGNNLVLGNNLGLGKLKKIFKKGVVISLKQPKLNQVMLSVLQDVEGNNIYFRASDEFFVGNILEGDRIECTMLIDDNEFILTGTIVKIQLNYPNLVEVMIDDFKNFKNRRKNKRYLVNLRANMSIPIENDCMKYSIVKNVSSEGVHLITNKNLEIGTTVRVKIAVDKTEIKAIEFVSLIKRADHGEGYSEYGLEISKIDEDNRELLDKLIYQLGKDRSMFVADNLK